MDGKAFEIAQQALSTIALYRGHYASSEQFDIERKKLVEVVREASRNNVGHPAFLSAFADALEAI